MTLTVPSTSASSAIVSLADVVTYSQRHPPLTDKPGRNNLNLVLSC